MGYHNGEVDHFYSHQSGGFSVRCLNIETTTSQLNVTPANQDVIAPAGTTTFEVTSNISWTVDESVSWLSVLPLSGGGNGTITVTYEANSSSEIRIGQIIITAEGGNPVVNVTVTQEGLPLPLAIGDNYGGGKVAYFFQPGDLGYVAGEVHGLIAAPNDQSIGASWNCHYITFGTSIALGTGQANTTLIVNGCDANYAANVCDTLVLNGYDDWFLPSSDELFKLYLNKSSIGGLALDYYWSSSEYGNTQAKKVDFQYGSNTAEYRSYSCHVRAVRSF